MVKKLLTFILVLFFSSTQAITLEEYNELARKDLRFYGLLSCLYEYLPKKTYTREDEIPTYYENNIEDMLRKAANLYGLSWGRHTVYQNEDTLEVLYNPYTETERFIKNLSYRYLKINKMNKDTNPVVRCLNAYESDEFKSFIRSLDMYISYIDFDRINEAEVSSE